MASNVRHSERPLASRSPTFFYVNAIDDRKPIAQSSFERQFISYLSDEDQQPVFVTPAPARQRARFHLQLPAKTRRPWSRLLFWIRQYRLLERALRRHGPLPVYFRSSGNLLVPVLFANRHHLPITIRMGPGHFDLFFYHRIPRLLTPVVRRYYQRVIDGATNIVVVTAQIKETLLAHYRVLPDKITVVPNPAPTDWRARVCPPLPATTGLTIGYVGSLHADQGLFTVAEALLRLHQRQQLPADLRLILVGDGPDRPRLEAFVAEHALRGHVHFVGRLAQDRLAEHYATFDCVVAPYSHAFNRVKGSSALKLTEYLSYGQYVLAAAIADYEFLATEKLGALYELENADALADLLLATYRQPPGRVDARAYLAHHRDESIIFPRYLELILGDE